MSVILKLLCSSFCCNEMKELEFHHTYVVCVLLTQEPYRVIVCAEALVVMDIVSMTWC